MKIQFLRGCEAPRNWMKTFCECCGPEPMPAEMTFFPKDSVEDPNEMGYEIDLSKLTYRVDFDIIEYP